MGAQFMEPKPFHGTSTEDAREWLNKLKDWLSYKNYANLPNPEDIVDADEKKSIVSAIGLAKRRIPY